MNFATEASSSPVWHFWLAVPIALGAIAVVVAIIAGYVISVSKTRYPKSDA
jgi:hypothetical protein